MKNKSHIRKMAAPIVITAIFVAYYAAFAVACILIDFIPVGIKIAGGAIPAVLAGIIIYVLIERIKEIRSGEEDDISKY